jgi:hypothetical protein
MKNMLLLMMIGIILPYHQNDNCDWGKDQNLLLLRCIKVSQERYVAFVEGGYTICAQPDREKADRCLEYYKSQHPTAEFWGLGKMTERSQTL